MRGGTGALAALTAGLYALGALLAFRWFDVDGLGPGFFPAAGVTLAALTLTRRRRWPWLLLAVGATELVINLAHDVPPGPAAGFAAANTVEPFVGALLLRLAAGRPDLSRRRDLWLFVGCAVLAGPAVGGAVAATVHEVLGSGVRPWPLFAARWALGDALGVLLVGGAVLGWRSGDPASRDRLATPGGAGLVVAALAASLAVFRWDVVWLGYLLAGLLVVVAFRLSTRGVGIAGLVMATVIGEASASGRITPPAGVSADATWFAVNLVVGLVVVVAFALAVEIAEREESVRRRREAEEARRAAEAEAASAGEREALLAAERRARARAELLQDVTARLSSLTAPARIVEEIAALTAQALGSRTGILALPGPDGRLRAAAAHGYDAGQRRRLDDALAAPGAVLPLTVAFGTGRFVAETGPGRVQERFPDTGRLPARFGAVAAVPCVVDGRVVGALGWGFEQPRTFDDDFAALVSAIAAQCALALERGRLFEAERRRSRQLGALQAAVGRMAAAPGTDEVVAAVLGPALAAVGAGGAVIGLAAAGGGVRVVAGHGPVAAADDAAALLAAAVADGEVVALPGVRALHDRFPALAGLAASGDGAWLAAPFAASSTARGGLLLGFADPQELDADQVSLLVTLAQAAGQSLGRAAAAEREHGVAVALQRSLLGEPDVVAGLEVATVYRPGTRDLHVGGDWYDVIRLPGGAAALAIGDVAGHSLAAAAAMGQIRSTLRALAALVPDPAELLTRLDSFVEQVDGAALTSLFYAVLDVEAGLLRYACAGHPPPVVGPRQGAAYFLDGGHGTLLGVDAGTPRTGAVATLAPSDVLVLYTDGLVERRGESLSVGLERLRAATGSAVRSAGSDGAGPDGAEPDGAEPDGADCRAVCEHLTRTVLGPDTDDDTALLVVRRRGG